LQQGCWSNWPSGPLHNARVQSAEFGVESFEETVPKHLLQSEDVFLEKYSMSHPQHFNLGRKRIFILKNNSQLHLWSRVFPGHVALLIDRRIDVTSDKFESEGSILQSRS
jgi:hypothetical protein